MPAAVLGPPPPPSGTPTSPRSPPPPAVEVRRFRTDGGRGEMITAVSVEEGHHHHHHHNHHHHHHHHRDRDRDHHHHRDRDRHSASAAPKSPTKRSRSLLSRIRSPRRLALPCGGSSPSPSPRKSPRPRRSSWSSGGGTKNGGGDEKERIERRLSRYDDDDNEYDRDRGLEVVISEDGTLEPEFLLSDVGKSKADDDDDEPMTDLGHSSRRTAASTACSSESDRTVEVTASASSSGAKRRAGTATASSPAAAATSSSGNGGGGGGGASKRRGRKFGGGGKSGGGGSGPGDPATDKEEQKKLSYFQMAKIGYNELVNAIIRPPRAAYPDHALGPTEFRFCGHDFERVDFVLETRGGMDLACSHWRQPPQGKKRGGSKRQGGQKRTPCVIYMHGNSSARVEVIPQLSYLLSLGVTVLSFDFAGSGRSEGEYVSLGYYEREDLMAVVAHLRRTESVSTIALWGRSMGAATALMHGDRDPSIACMVLDSPFVDLTQLAEEMVEKGRKQGINVPNFVVSVAIRMIRGSVKKRAGFDIKHIAPIRHADKCFIPALFVAGEHDDFIDKRHSEAIHARYAGDKNLIIVEGDHNSPRPKFMFDSASVFLQACLQIPRNGSLCVPLGMNLLAPPWFYPGSDGKFVPAPPALAGMRRMTGPLVTSQAVQRRNGVGVSGRTAAVAGKVTTAVVASPSSGGADRKVRGPSHPASGGAVAAGAGGANHLPTSPPRRKAAAPATSVDPAVPTGNGFDSDNVGMTKERQREIQASLFKMLGSSEGGGNGGGSERRHAGDNEVRE